MKAQAVELLVEEEDTSHGTCSDGLLVWERGAVLCSPTRETPSRPERGRSITCGFSERKSSSCSLRQRCCRSSQLSEVV